MDFRKIIRSLRARLREWENNQELEPGQADEFRRALKCLEHALATKSMKDVRAAMAKIAKVFLRN